MKLNNLFKILFVIYACCSGSAFAENTRKPGFEFFDHVYSINLEHCVDRKKHIINEFARVGIKNYEIFKAVDKNSPEVAFWMKSGFVKRYPPCFRCNKNRCACKNNVLVKSQIGNWLSFIHVFKDIVEKDYEFVLITEDDVKFVDNAPEIFAKLINKQNFARYNIDLNKPILIRFEKRGEIGDGINKIGFTKDATMSNACFMVNKQFAKSFLANLQQIDRTSDMYLQVQLLKLDPTIQHFSAFPQPAYQLSENAIYPRFKTTADNTQQRFRSEIHSPEDLVKNKKDKRRIEYHEYLIKKYLAFITGIGAS